MHVFKMYFYATNTLYTGNACRKRASIKLSKKYATPKEAEIQLQAILDAECQISPQSRGVSPQPVPNTCNIGIQVVLEDLVPIYTAKGDLPAQITTLLNQMELQVQLDKIGSIFSQIGAEHYGISVPPDFLALSLSAFRHLNTCDRSNVLYNIAKGIGKMRDDGTDSLLPTRRMPMGLLEHLANLLVADSLQQVGVDIECLSNETIPVLNVPIQVPTCPKDYLKFQQTNYSLFGTKWTKLSVDPCGV